MKHPRAGLLLLCLALWLPGFFTLPPGDRDESRFAQASKQMIETGDYVRIMNGIEPRNRKPIGIHWLQVPAVLAAQAFGIARANPIWPYRLPSLAGGALSVLGTFEIGLALDLTAEAAGLGAGMLAASLLLMTETHIAKTDAALLGATVLAMLGLARAWQGRSGSALFWIALAVGILLKGPVEAMVVGLSVLALWVTERKTPKGLTPDPAGHGGPSAPGRSSAGPWPSFLHPSWGIPLLLAIILPWFIAIAFATNGTFFADSVGGDLGRKLAGGDDAHGAPPGTHLLLLPLLAFPSTLIVLGGLLPSWRARAEPAVRFLLCWVVPSWIVFEAVPTKLPHYTLPLYPALFLLGARWWTDPSRRLVHRVVQPLRGLVCLAGALIAAGAIVLPIVLHSPWWLGLPAAAACVLCAGFAVSLRPRAAIAAAVLLSVALLQWEVPHLPGLWIAPRVAALLRTAWPYWNPAGRGLAVAGFAEPSLMFVAGTRIDVLPDATAATKSIAAGRDSAVLIDRAAEPALLKGLASDGVAARDVGGVAGFNASRARWVELRLVLKE